MEQYKGFWVRDRMDRLIVDENDWTAYLGRHQLRDDDVVLDIGAHIGTFSVKVSPSVAKVVGVEPDPANFSLARANTKDYRNISLIRKAVAAETGSATLIFGKYSYGHSLTRKLQPHGSINVETIALSELLDEVKPTVVKFDIEGGEYLLDLDLLKCARLIVGELHGSRGGQKAEAAAALETLGRSFEVETWKGNWVTLLGGERRW